jgi:hypothetical protein
LSIEKIHERFVANVNVDCVRTAQNMLHSQLGYIGLATTFLLASPVSAQNPICYVCSGDPDATISNPDALIDVPPEFNLPVTQASCFQVFQAGLSNLIPAEACDLIVEDVDAQIFCGCSNIVNPVAAPVAAPKPIPVDTPSPITVPVATPTPIAVPNDTPTPVALPGVTPVPLETEPPELPTPVATLPPGTAKPSIDDGGVEAPTECNGKGKGGMMGMDSGKGKGMGMGKGNDDSSASGKGKGGMMMGKKCKKVPKEPKTPKVGKGME